MYKKDSQMINNQHKIEIDATPKVVFAQIEKNPFPTFKLLETRPFLFIRLALVDGLRAGAKIAFSGDLSEKMNEPLKLGTSMGPFKVTEVEKGKMFYFTLKSFFFNCKTGFSINEIENGSLLTFDIFADKLKMREKIYWFLIKPIHGILARRVLRVHKKTSESA